MGVPALGLLWVAGGGTDTGFLTTLSSNSTKYMYCYLSSKTVLTQSFNPKDSFYDDLICYNKSCSNIQNFPKYNVLLFDQEI